MAAASLNQQLVKMLSMGFMPCLPTQAPEHERQAGIHQEISKYQQKRNHFKPITGDIKAPQGGKGKPQERAAHIPEENTCPGPGKVPEQKAQAAAGQDIKKRRYPGSGTSPIRKPGQEQPPPQAFQTGQAINTIHEIIKIGHGHYEKE